MENNNDNNLFTNMFGIESEEPKEQVPTEQKNIQTLEPSPVVESTTTPTQQPIQTIAPTKPIQEEIIVLDSNKPTQEPVVEQPVVEEQSLNTMNLNSNYIPVQTSFESEDDVIDLRNLKPSHYKTISIILGITLLVVLLAFLLYFGLNNYLSKNNKEEVQEPVTNQPAPTPTPEPKPVEPTQPPINFDLDLSFDNGYTQNPNEYHIKQGFDPTNSEGVVLCESIKPIIYGGVGVQNVFVYIYYKDYQTKKLLTINDWQFINQELYNENLMFFQSTSSMLSGNEHLYTQILVDNKEYIIQYYMLADLAYNQAVRLPDSKYYFDIKISYNTPIKKAMNHFITKEGYTNNMYCSTIITNDTSL